MADKIRSTTVSLGFAPLGHSSFAFLVVFSNWGKPQTPYKNNLSCQMLAAEVREAQAEVVTEALCQPSEFLNARLDEKLQPPSLVV